MNTPNTIKPTTNPRAQRSVRASVSDGSNPARETSAVEDVFEPAPRPLLHKRNVYCKLSACHHGQRTDHPKQSDMSVSPLRSKRTAAQDSQRSDQPSKPRLTAGAGILSSSKTPASQARGLTVLDCKQPSTDLTAANRTFCALLSSTGSAAQSTRDQGSSTEPSARGGLSWPSILVWTCPPQQARWSATSYSPQPNTNAASSDSEPRTPWLLRGPQASAWGALSNCLTPLCSGSNTSAPRVAHCPSLPQPLRLTASELHAAAHGGTHPPSRLSSNRSEPLSSEGNHIPAGAA